MTVLPSRHHPQGAGRSLVYARAIAQPLAVSFTAVMVVALAAVLQGHDVLGEMMWVAPLVYAVVSVWAVHQLQRRPAALVLDGSRGAVPSVWDVAGRGSVMLHPVFSPRWEGSTLNVPVGRQVHGLRSEDWPDFGAVERAVRATAEASQAHRIELSMGGR